MMRRSWPEGGTWNAQLATLAIAEMARAPGSQLGVGTGWSGPKTFFDFPAAAALQEFIHSCLGPGWQLSAWANVMRQGDVVRAHNHERSHLGGSNTWAGVYYVTVPAGSGALVLEGESIEPEPSMLVVFASGAMHEVRRHESRDPRISIAFNARRCPIMRLTTPGATALN